jgi:hypothetical protein
MNLGDFFFGSESDLNPDNGTDDDSGAIPEDDEDLR